MAKQRSRKWIQEALGTRARRKGKGPHHKKAVRIEAKKKGQLHRDMGIPVGQKIPVKRLNSYIVSTRRKLEASSGQKRKALVTKLKRATLAKTMRGFKRARRK